MAPLISVRAGRCERRAGTNWVDPLPARGLLVLEKSPEDGLLRFQYKNIETNTSIEDLILFPGDALLQAIPSNSGRIYVLRFTSSSARHFYWLQDVEEAQDARNVARINQLIDDPDASEADLVIPSRNEGPSTSASQQDDAAMDDAPSSAHDRTAQLSLAAPSAASASTPQSSSHVTASQMAQLQALLAQAADPSQGGLGSTPQRASVSLADILSSSRLLDLLSTSPGIAETLYPFLPPASETVPHTVESLRQILTSPELRKSARSLDQALTTGALGPLAASLGLSSDETFGVEAYLKGVQRLGDEENAKEGRSGGIGMQTD